MRAWHASLAKSSTLRSRTKAYGLLGAIMNSAVDEELIQASPVHIRGAGAAASARGRVHRRLVRPPLRRARQAAPEGHRRRQPPDQGRRAVTFPPGGVVVGPPKSEAGYRDVSIPPHIWPFIEEHLEKWVRPGQNTLLFPGEARGHIVALGHGQLLHQGQEGGRS